ncbi:MAG TPA: TolC family protein [Isosphaeraceae bacterium]|jgi:outer membrane protein TolC|nr:TolC family protein [Isosphaeraceae bacterium]
MNRKWSLILFLVLIVGACGCTQSNQRPELAQTDDRMRTVAFHHADASYAPQSMTVALDPAPTPSDLTGVQPLDLLIRRALAENRTVQAAYHNVQSLRHRFPQVTKLDDPVASNAVFPIPSVAPQYSLMGYNPYNLTLAQQFPWFGTLRLRGEVAERDVQVALAELAAAQLDTVAAVKRAYYNLYASTRTQEILSENRKILEDFRAIARERLASGGTQQDVLRAEVLISELDREFANNQQGIATARAALARQLHISPEADLQTLPELPLASVPAEFDRLCSLAIAVRPELQGRLAAVARDEKAIELARKRFYPNVTLGLTYMDMEKTNATTPKTASGFPNVGLFVAFNLPVYQQKYRAGVCEAEQRALADARLYEAQRDETSAEIQDFMTQAKVQQNVLTLLRDSILPRAREVLDLARSDYAKGNVDYATVQSALREVLQVQLQMIGVEAELAKALAALERAVGSEINEHPPGPAETSVARPAPTTTPPPPGAPGPFQPTVPAAVPEPPSLR